MSQSFGFNLAEVKPDAGGFGEPIPAGWYKLQADEGSIEETGGGTGSMVKVRFAVEEGDFKGRKVFQNFNIVNSNEDAQRIGRSQLAALAHAIGRPSAQGPHELLGVTFWGKVQIEKGKSKDPQDPNGEKHPDRNKVGTFKHINETPKDLGSSSSGASSAPKNPFGDTAPPKTNPPAPVASPAPVAAPSVPTPPAPAAPTPPKAHNPMEKALADGWIAHPEGGGWFYKGNDVKQEADVAALYPAPAAPSAPAVPSAPSVPTPPAQAPAAAPAIDDSTPPWARGK